MFCSLRFRHLFNHKHTIAQCRYTALLWYSKESKETSTNMAKHRSWHGADIKRARKKKLKAEKKKKQQL